MVRLGVGVGGGVTVRDSVDVLSLSESVFVRVPPKSINSSFEPHTAANRMIAVGMKISDVHDVDVEWSIVVTIRLRMSNVNS